MLELEASFGDEEALGRPVNLALPLMLEYK